MSSRAAAHTASYDKNHHLAPVIRSAHETIMRAKEFKTQGHLGTPHTASLPPNYRPTTAQLPPLCAAQASVLLSLEKIKIAQVRERSTESALPGTPRMWCTGCVCGSTLPAACWQRAPVA